MRLLAKLMSCAMLTHHLVAHLPLARTNGSTARALLLAEVTKPFSACCVSCLSAENKPYIARSQLSGLSREQSKEKRNQRGIRRTLPEREQRAGRTF